MSRITLVSVVCLCLGLVSAVDARGPVPSFGGGGGFSTGGIGVGGISFGGGRGGISIGTGHGTIGVNRGGVSFGNGIGEIRVAPGRRGGRHVPETDHRGRHTPEHNHHERHPHETDRVTPQEHHHFRPQPRPVPQPIPVPIPRPEPRFEPRHQPMPEIPHHIPRNEIPEPQPQPEPEPQIPEHYCPCPEPNPINLTGRQVTDQEVARAQDFFAKRLVELGKLLEQRIPAVEYDMDTVIATMGKYKVPTPTQVEIIDALERGEIDTAKRIWTKWLPRVRIPFWPHRIRILIVKILREFERGRVTYPEFQEVVMQIPPEHLRPTSCCGVDDLLAQLEEEVKINHVIAGYPLPPMEFDKPREYGKPSEPEKPNQFGKPSHPDKPSDSQTVEPHPWATGFGKPGGNANGNGQPYRYGKPGQKLPLPTGIVNIVHHPKLPEGNVVVVNSETVMIGTGGQGVFRMDRGRVAEFLGHKMAEGTPLERSESELVRSGTLIVNPTRSAVSFVFGSHQVTLKPGYRQVFRSHAPKVISFDRGAGKKAARYTLNPGTYHFAVGSDGWSIAAKKYEISISNEGNHEPFRYMFQGRHLVLEPEQTETHASDYPILVRFDRGNEMATKQVRWLGRSGTVQVAVNPADNLWDLFAAKGAAATTASKADFVPAF